MSLRGLFLVALQNCIYKLGNALYVYNAENTVPAPLGRMTDKDSTAIATLKERMKKRQLPLDGKPPLVYNTKYSTLAKVCQEKTQKKELKKI